MAWERAPNEMPSWQGQITAAEAHYCQMCFVLQKGVIAPSMTSPSCSLSLLGNSVL